MKIFMEKEDVQRVLEAVEILDVFNCKYGKPHGGNPLGIYFAAIECARKKIKKEKEGS